MTRRHYSNTAAAASAAVIVGSGDTAIPLADYSGFPTAPYIAAIDKDTEDEEIVLVTEVLGSTVTITRGYDGTLAKAHAAGASFRHVASAKDFDEANAHVNATAAHGVTGDVVGTSDTQTLTNKTLTSPTISNPDFTGTVEGVSAAFSATVAADTLSAVTLSTTGNGTVGGTLTVTGAVTLSSTLAAGAATLASATVAGNVGVGGTLGVSGALSGASAAFTGNVAAATLSATTTTTDEVELEQQATDLAAAASHSSLYAKTGGGLWFRPNGQDPRRAPMVWPSGATLPTVGAIQGDTFYHTGLSSLLRYNGTNWRQIDGPVAIANMAARPTHADRHPGFSVLDLSTDRIYFYDGTYWRTPDAMGFIGDLGGAGAGDYITAISQTEVGDTNSSGQRGFGFNHTFSAAPIFVQATVGSSGSNGTVRGVWAEAGAHDTTGIQLRFTKSDGSPAASVTVRVNYTVIGYNN